VGVLGLVVAWHLSGRAIAYQVFPYMGTVRVLDSAPSESRGPGGRSEGGSVGPPSSPAPASQPGCPALRHRDVAARARAGRDARAGRRALGAAGTSRAHGFRPRGWGWSRWPAAAPTRGAQPGRATAAVSCAGHPLGCHAAKPQAEARARNGITAAVAGSMAVRPARFPLSQVPKFSAVVGRR